MPFLKPEVICASQESRLVVCTSQARIVVETAEVGPLPAGTPIELNSLLADLTDARERSAMLETLSVHQALSDAQLPESWWPSDIAMPLATAVRDVRCGVPVFRVAVFTTDEALWLGADADLNRAALRLFISRFEDVDHRVLYGALAAGANVTIGGDLPPLDALEAILALVDDSQGVASWNLNSLTPTGGANHIADLGEAGRIGVTQVVDNRDVWTGCDERVVISVGVSALPNLAVTATLDFKNLVPGVVGVASKPDLARAKCIAEGIERFASGSVDPTRITVAKAQDLRSWLDPREVFNFTAPQRQRRGLTEFRDDEAGYWIEGRRDRSPIWVAAALVYYPFSDLPPWLPASAVSSSGVAAADSRPEAITRAWLELVERDAFQRVMATGPLDPPDLLVLGEDASKPLVLLLEHLRTYGEVTLLALPTPDHVPTVLARCETDDGIALGMSASKGEEEAAWKAATEALAQADRPYRYEMQPEDVETPGDHAALYRHGHFRKELDWMLRGTPRAISSSTVRVSVPRERVAVVDLTCSFAPRTFVVRVLDPTLIPLTFGYDSEPLGRADLRELWQRRGHDEMQPLLPHPFA